MKSLQLGDKWNHFWCMVLGHDTRWWFYDPCCDRCGADADQIKAERRK